VKTISLIVYVAFCSFTFLNGSLRVHRTDALGEDSPTSPRFDHTEARAEAKLVFPELAKKYDWDFTQSSDSEIFTDVGLKNIDVIILDNNTGILFTEKQKQAFENWIRNGGGVVGIHGATHAHKGVDENNHAEWPFWYAMWGVLHKTGPKEGPLGRRGYADQIHIINAADPWSRNLPKQWIFDKVEWYFWNYHKSYSDKQIIAIAEVKTNQPELPEYYPVTWCQDYEGGRVWYTNMGHYAENFRQQAFVQHLVDGIHWVAKESTLVED
jgi:type 1 glutamine amidotransferase